MSASTPCLNRNPHEADGQWSNTIQRTFNPACISKKQDWARVYHSVLLDTWWQCFTKKEATVDTISEDISWPESPKTHQNSSWEISSDANRLIAALLFKPRWGHCQQAKSVVMILNRHCGIEKRIFTFGNSAYSTFKSGFNVDRTTDCWLVSSGSLQETFPLFRDSSSLVKKKTAMIYYHQVVIIWMDAQLFFCINKHILTYFSVGINAF